MLQCRLLCVLQAAAVKFSRSLEGPTGNSDSCCGSAEMWVWFPIQRLAAYEYSQTHSNGFLGTVKIATVNCKLTKYKQLSQAGRCQVLCRWV